MKNPIPDGCKTRVPTRPQGTSVVEARSARGTQIAFYLHKLLGGDERSHVTCLALYHMRTKGMFADTQKLGTGPNAA